jgi:hypothetical protein
MSVVWVVELTDTNPDIASQAGQSSGFDLRHPLSKQNKIR